MDQPVAVRRPALRYFGGKWRLAPWIIAHLPEHRCYVEAFGGGASVLLRKPPSTVEVYNDLASEVVNFFRVLRSNGDALRAQLALTPFAYEEYTSCRDQIGDPVERARRFFVRSWGGHHGTNGSGRNRGWRRTWERNVAGQMATAAEALAAVSARLRGVAIDALDWAEILERYDSSETCFYLDPPYLAHTRKSPHPSDGYGRDELSESAHESLLSVARAVQGAVVISGYSDPLYDRMLRDWRRVERGAEVLWIKKTVS